MEEGSVARRVGPKTVARLEEVILLNSEKEATRCRQWKRCWRENEVEGGKEERKSESCC